MIKTINDAAKSVRFSGETMDDLHLELATIFSGDADAMTAMIAELKTYEANAEFAAGAAKRLREVLMQQAEALRGEKPETN